ncbi:MAG: glycoside hydrolase family 2 protein [Bryobacterales bacterium]|nr:glycoside hydrolase family 2 protein [Bryobacterales bacterium]
MIAACSNLREDVALGAPDVNMHALSIPLDTGWEMASTSDPQNPATVSELRFMPAKVPATVASTLREHNAWRMGDGARFDASEHWFRCRFEAEPAGPAEEVALQIGGIATVAEVWLNGEEILSSSSMFASHEVDISALVRDRNELLIVCRSLVAAMRLRRRHPPAARWRTRVVAEQQLRWFRTTLLGRAPGFAPEPEPVGPWRPITLVRRRQIVVEDWSRRAELDGSTGVIHVRIQMRSLRPAAEPVSGRLLAGDADAPLEWQDYDGRHHGRAVLRIQNVQPWWPHTHGQPVLYPLRAELQLADGSNATFENVPVGFRSVDAGAEPAGGGIALKINGVPVFCRGVVWTPPDAAALAASSDLIRERLRRLRDGGFNLIRLAGTSVYEGEAFHRLCDELGLLVWQDMMFANMDYPFEDSDFRDTVRAEAEAEMSRLARHPSSTILCGNSEIEQQVGMLGLDPALGRGSFFGDELPRIADRCCPGIPYIPSAPCGGDLPFHTRRGVANYFGVGAYLRPLEDVRRAEVRFASECLAFANVPEPEMLDQMSRATPGGISPMHPAWKRSIPRDSGAGWDFEDVRDHYLTLLYSADPVTLRYADTARYWELSRMVSGEIMAEVFGEWRRGASPCSGGIILWSADLTPGAGWGILDSEGQPKAAYWFLKRALAPCTVWMTDEGLNGIDIHVANDRAAPMEAWLRVALYRMGEHRVAESDIAITIPNYQTEAFGLEQILGRFIDAACAYRFGPPGHDVVAASLHLDRGDVPFAQAFRFPAGRTTQRRPIAELGMSAQCRLLADGTIQAVVSSLRFAWGVRVAAPGYLPDDAYFGIEPGRKRRIVLTPLQPRETPISVAVTTINAEGRFAIAVERSA